MKHITHTATSALSYQKIQPIRLLKKTDYDFRFEYGIRTFDKGMEFVGFKFDIDLILYKACNIDPAEWRYRRCDEPRPFELIVEFEKYQGFPMPTTGNDQDSDTEKIYFHIVDYRFYLHDAPVAYKDYKRKRKKKKNDQPTLCIKCGEDIFNDLKM